MQLSGTPPGWDIRKVERPIPALFTYYILSSLVLGPFFPFALLYLYFRYHTMRYQFDAEGVSMSWGILYHREIHLTYTRIQDIHLVSNVVERWLGLARIQIQTASGSASAEMTLEGIAEYAAVRDYLYQNSRGAKPSELHALLPEATPEPLAAEFHALAGEIRALRATLARRGERGPL
jgi:putative membrane protein